MQRPRLNKGNAVATVKGYVSVEYKNINKKLF